MPLAQLVLTLIFPALAIGLAGRFRLFSSLGPVVITYLLGISLPCIINSLPETSYRPATADAVLSVALPVSLPLLLFGMNIRHWLQNSRSAVLSFGLACLATTLAATLIFLLSRYLAPAFYQPYGNEPELMAGMMAAMYTGGTPNMAVVHQSLSDDANLFLLLNSADVLVGGLWLVGLLSLAKPLLSRVLPEAVPSALPVTDQSADSDPLSGEPDTLPELTDIRSVARLLGFTILAAVLVALSAAISQALLATINVPLVLLLVTASGVAVALTAGRLSATTATRGCYEVGSYLVLIFCCALGSLVDPVQLLSGTGPLLLYVAAIMLLSFTLHLSMAKLAGLDVDTFLITHTAALYGPPFVPAVAHAIGNKRLLVAGITTGLVGYACGSYMGLALVWLLQFL